MTWANLLLQVNPIHLDASQRIRLVNTMAEYLRLPSGSVSLFSMRKSFSLQQEKQRVCHQGGQAQSLTGNRTKNQDVIGELLWPVGCQGDERQSSLAMVLEHTTKAGGIARLLGTAVLGWRVVCVPGDIQRKVKRDVRWPRHTPTPNMIIPPPTHAQEIVKLVESSLMYSPLLPHTQCLRLSSIMVHMSPVGTQLKPTHTQGSTVKISEQSATKVDNLPGSSLNSLMFVPEWHTQKEKMPMYYSNIRTEVPLAILQSSYMQRKQSSTPLSSIIPTIPYSELSHALLDTQIFLEEKDSLTLHTSNCIEFACSHAFWFPPYNFEEYASVTVEGTGHSQEPQAATFNIAFSPLSSRARSKQASIFDSLKTSGVWLEGHIWRTELFLSHRNTQQNTQLAGRVQGSPVSQIMESGTAVNPQYLKYSEESVQYIPLGSIQPSLLISKMEELESQSAFSQESISTFRSFSHTLFDKPAYTTLSTSHRPHSIHLSLPLASVSYSVRPMVTHETDNREPAVTSVSLHPHPKENPISPVCWTATHTDSECRSEVMSLGKSCSFDLYMTIYYCPGWLVIYVCI